MQSSRVVAFRSVPKTGADLAATYSVMRSCPFLHHEHRRGVYTIAVGVGALFYLFLYEFHVQRTSQSNLRGTASRVRNIGEIVMNHF